MIERVLGDVNIFLEAIYSNLRQAGIAPGEFWPDHLCYRVSTTDEYEKKKVELAEYGEIIAETEVNGRPIATYRLHEPLTYAGHEIYLVELPSPKKGTNYKSGLEHVEFVTGRPLEEMLKKYPGIKFSGENINDQLNPDIKITFPDGLTVKFHPESLEKVIEKEQGLLPD